MRIHMKTHFKSREGAMGGHIEVSETRIGMLSLTMP
jgi:hypothetical protein